MTFLPIVDRELRVAARQRTVFWTRVGGAAAAILLSAWIMLIPGLRTPQRLGAALFHTIAVATFIYSAMAGLLRTSDCLSEEKREGTLGLLFLTDLKGYDIVFGKLAATTINTFYAMLATFPVMAISLLAGGVGVAEFWRVVLVALNNLFFSLAIGIFCSAISRDERKAVGLAIFLMIFFAAGFPVIGLLLAEARNVRPPDPLFFIPSPGYAAFMSFDETFKGLATFNFFYASVACVHGMAWTLLALSSIIVPRTWQDKVQTRRGSWWRQRLRDIAYGSAQTRARARKLMLDINPMYWLAGRDRMAVALVWAFLIAVGVFWLWGTAKYRNDWYDEPTYVLFGLFLHGVLKCWVATEACRRFTADRRTGAIELLLSTPISVREILNGQLLALLKQFALPAMVIVLADIAFLFTNRQDDDWVLVWVAGISVFVADLIALAWVSMWMGLKSVKTNRASGAAIVRVLVLPWLLFAALVTAVAVYEAFNRGRLPDWIDNDPVPVITWMAISLIVDVLFGVWAYRNLTHRFRETVAARFERRRPFWFRSSAPAAPSVPPVRSPAIQPGPVATDARL